MFHLFLASMNYKNNGFLEHFASKIVWYGLMNWKVKLWYRFSSNPEFLITKANEQISLISKRSLVTTCWNICKLKEVLQDEKLFHLVIFHNVLYNLVRGMIYGQVNGHLNCGTGSIRWLSKPAVWFVLLLLVPSCLLGVAKNMTWLTKLICYNDYNLLFVYSCCSCRICVFSDVLLIIFLQVGPFVFHSLHYCKWQFGWGFFCFELLYWRVGFFPAINTIFFSFFLFLISPNDG